MNENVDIFCMVLGKTTLDGQWSQPRNMSDYSTWLAYDIMGDLVFGKKFDCLMDNAHRFVPRLLMSSSGFIYPVGQCVLSREPVTKRHTW